MAARELEEVLKEVRRIQIVARRQVNDLLAGEYLSAFKGRGMEFDTVREYVPGDQADRHTSEWPPDGDWFEFERHDQARPL